MVYCVEQSERKQFSLKFVTSVSLLQIIHMLHSQNTVSRVHNFIFQFDYLLKLASLLQ